MTGLVDVPYDRFGLPLGRAVVKRVFDIGASLILLALASFPIGILYIGARFSTGQSGIYSQQRVGLYGKAFRLHKIRSMRPMDGIETTVTTGGDPRITRFGRFLRESKLDELPQLWNVLIGEMSFVGPRPDVAEAYRNLSDADKRILTVRPGITGPASIHFREEEDLFLKVKDPEAYNREVVFPKKVSLNLQYIDQQSLIGDIMIMIKTVL